MSDEITVRPAATDDLDAIARIKTIGFGGNEAERHNRPNPGHGHQPLRQITATGNGQQFILDHRRLRADYLVNGDQRCCHRFEDWIARCRRPELRLVHR